MRNHDVVDDSGIDRRGSRRELLKFVENDPEAQRELGATLHPDEEAEALRFVDANPDYFPSDVNFANLREYLRARRLSFLAEHLTQAWIHLKAVGRAVFPESPAPSAEVSPTDIERMGDQEVVEQFQQLRAARLARQARAKKYLKESLV